MGALEPGVPGKEGAAPSGKRAGLETPLRTGAEQTSGGLGPERRDRGSPLLQSAAMGDPEAEAGCTKSCPHPAALPYPRLVGCLEPRLGGVRPILRGEGSAAPQFPHRSRAPRVRGTRHPAAAGLAQDAAAGPEGPECVSACSVKSQAGKGRGAGERGGRLPSRHEDKCARGREPSVPRLHTGVTLRGFLADAHNPALSGTVARMAPSLRPLTAQRV